MLQNLKKKILTSLINIFQKKLKNAKFLYMVQVGNQKYAKDSFFCSIFSIVKFDSTFLSPTELHHKIENK